MLEKSTDTRFTGASRYVLDEELAQMADQGTYWVVTPLIYHKQFESFRATVADPETPVAEVEWAMAQVRRHEWIWDNMPRAILKAHDIGVNIVIGSDQLYPEVGINALPLDMKMMVDIGLPAMVCKILGKSDFILSPRPAAKIITARFLLILFLIFYSEVIWLLIQQPSTLPFICFNCTLKGKTVFSP